MALDLCKNCVFPQCLQNGWNFMKVLYVCFGTYKIEILEIIFYYTSANCVCGRVYCFHVVRPSERVSLTFCFLNILKSL